VIDGYFEGGSSQRVQPYAGIGYQSLVGSNEKLPRLKMLMWWVYKSIKSGPEAATAEALTSNSCGEVTSSDSAQYGSGFCRLLVKITQLTG